MAFGSSADTLLKSIKGRLLGLTEENNLVSNEVRVTHPVVDATITVSDETTNVRTIDIQLLDSNGNDASEVTPFEIHMFTDATGVAYAGTGGSTGIEIGSDGALLAIVAKKIFACTSEADGDWDGTWTDTGTEQVAIGVKLPNGNMVISSAFANT